MELVLILLYMLVKFSKDFQDHLGLETFFFHLFLLPIPFTY